MKKTREWRLSMLGYDVWLTVGRRRTCWWANDWHPRRRLRVRQDHLIGLFRAYSRVTRTYGWQIICGRLKISILG